MIKKLFILLLILTIFFIPLNIHADSEIKGFEKNYNELFMRNYFTEEEFKVMEQNFKETFDRNWPELIYGLKASGGMETNNEETEYVHRYNTYKPDFDYGLLVSVLEQNFLYEYAKKNCMSYLFVGDYFKVIKGRYNNEYTLDGKMTSSYFAFSGYNTRFLHTEEFFEYLERENLIKLMTEKNITEVIDMRIFGLNDLSFLYIQSPNAEYLMKIYPYEDVVNPRLKNIENNKLYPAQEVIGEIENQYILLCGGEVYLELDLSRTKKNYEDKALFLQAEGLLKGNEKGLDLLKPLTRIEAATMILRALGESTTNKTTTQTFADVPATHWGYGAAENAYSLGLIKGVGDDMFAPDDIVTGTQFATMVLRAGNHADFNWEEALDILVSESVISTDDTATMDFFTRGDMAKIIYEARAKGLLN